MRMMSTKSIHWIQVGDYDEMSELAASIFEQQLLRKPDSTLGLATGGSPQGFYVSLVKRYINGGFSFKKVNTFNLDEYIGLGPDDETSYHHYMKRSFFDFVDIPVSQQHLPNGLADDLLLECQLYEQAIEESGWIDLQLLGIGVNGHIGFNEPGTAFQSKTQVIDLTEETRNKNSKYFSSEAEVPAQAITMGLRTIMKAKQIILLAFGEEKAGAIARLQAGTVTEDFPASILHHHPNVKVLYGK
nr:glucosamine-6-phosphate deaminase [Planococcus beigongshangi]